MATNAKTGLEDEIASPGYYGSFPWADRCRNLYGIILVHNAREGSRAHAIMLQLIGLVRKSVGGCQVVGLLGRPAPGPSRTEYRFRFQRGIPTFEMMEGGTIGYRTPLGRRYQR